MVSVSHPALLKEWAEPLKQLYLLIKSRDMAANTKKKPVSQTKQSNQAPKPNATFDPLAWWKDSGALLMAGILTVLTFLVFSPALEGEFLNWDDDVNVYKNEYVKHLNAENVKKIFTTTVIGNYNPLANLTFAIEWYFFGDNPYPYHLTNLILHLLNCLCVFWLLLMLGLRKNWAFFAALLFAIHPMRVESVAWITERKDVLFGFFYLCALICYVYQLKTEQKKYMVGVFLFFVLALLSKIQAVALPLSLLLIDYLLDKPVGIKMILTKIPHFALSLAVGLMGVFFLKSEQSLNGVDYNILERLLVGAYSLAVYLVKVVYPYAMSAIYPYPEPGNLDWTFYASPILVAAMVGTVFWFGRKQKPIQFGFLFFLFNIVFLLQVVSAGQGFIADRFSYIPYFGLFFLFAYGLQQLETRQKSLSSAWIGLAAVASIGYIVMTTQQIPVWNNTESLFTDVIEYDSKVPTAYRNRGNYYRDSKPPQIEKAIADYDKAILIAPKDASFRTSRGKMYFDLKQYDKAFEDFSQSVLLDSTKAETFTNRGSIYGMRQQFPEAIRDFSKAVQLDPNWKVAWLNRAIIHYQSGNPAKAIPDLDAYIKLDAFNDQAFSLRGLCKVQTNDLAGGLVDYDKAIELNPKDANYFQNRSILYGLKGDTAASSADRIKAQQMGFGSK